MPRSLVKNPDDIHLGIIGMTPGNGHPYSWSAIINNYDPASMKKLCPYPGIIRYMEREHPATIGLPGVKVTHVYCDDPEDARKIAEVSRIPNIAQKSEDLLNAVDAVIIATDIGGQHVRRARPFVEHGIPVFIDKPLCDTREDLKIFQTWIDGGARILSSSSMRYCKEFIPYHNNKSREFGELRHIFVPMCKYWETYGIHALEAVYPILGPGFVSVRNEKDHDRDLVVLEHANGCAVTIACIRNLSFTGTMMLCGTEGGITLQTLDSYSSFRSQLAAFSAYLRNGIPPFGFHETIELMNLLIGGIESGQNGGGKIFLNHQF